MPPTNPFDSLIADLTAGLDLLAEQRGQPSASFAKAWGHPVTDLAQEAAETRRSITDSRRRTAATRRLVADIEAMRTRVAATSVATRDVLAAARRDRLRTGMKSVMSKAMALFAAGEISGDQVRVIEARSLRIGQALSL